ncbi:MAG: hypothetical protein EOO38_03835 [Cytophagaceae bacterium]|nr:MAG: hypothetical protein EOO38_03835 [Cytophagaceae bacterium]
MAFLRQLGLRDTKFRGLPAISISYADQLGRETCVRIRMSLTGQRFCWRTGAKPSPYGLDRLEDARIAKTITLVEGDSDAQTLWHHELPALGLPGATSWQDSWGNLLAGIDSIFVVIEPDQGGSALMAKLAKSALRDRIRCIQLGVHKDVSELHRHEPEHFVAAMEAAKSRAVSLAEVQDAADQAQQEEDQKLCAMIAHSPDILTLVAESTMLSGFVGETSTLKILYLAVTSRVLARPISVVVKGPSSAGKSAVVDCALSYFPQDAYHCVSSMSERAMAYSEEPLVHRMLVVYEAAGMKGEMASYLIRSLLSEGRIRYETVEKTAEGMRPRLIEREGPTGLLVTTTDLNLHPENETRMFSLLATDNAEQTTAVMASMARKHAGRRTLSTDFGPWHAFQRCIARGEVEVAIPFAEAIAAGIHPVAVRLRRDFGALLHLVQAHAVLHRATRERDEQGRIIAEIADYSAIYTLLDPILADGLGTSVSSTMRETVQAVACIAAEHGAASMTDVAGALSLDTSAASRRVHAAIKRGFLQNEELQPRRRARVVLDMALPTDRGILPLPASLQVCGANGSEP